MSTAISFCPDSGDVPELRVHEGPRRFVSVRLSDDISILLSADDDADLDYLLALRDVVNDSVSALVALRDANDEVA